MLKKLYSNNIEKKSFILCKKSFKTDKTDIIINIKGIKKYISVNGKIKCRKSVKLNVGFPTFYFTIYKSNR